MSFFYYSRFNKPENIQLFIHSPLRPSTPPLDPRSIPSTFDLICVAFTCADAAQPAIEDQNDSGKKFLNDKMND